jgi:hypothetical protein
MKDAFMIQYYYIINIYARESKANIQKRDKREDDEQSGECAFG